MTDPRLTRRRIRCAIEAMRAIGHDEIQAMTDEEISEFRDAMSGPWMMTKSDLYRRADTQWPDALEAVA